MCNLDGRSGGIVCPRHRGACGQVLGWHSSLHVREPAMSGHRPLSRRLCAGQQRLRLLCRCSCKILTAASRFAAATAVYTTRCAVATATY